MVVVMVMDMMEEKHGIHSQCYEAKDGTNGRRAGI
jgi:hypothetical protein